MTVVLSRTWFRQLALLPALVTTGVALAPAAFAVAGPLANGGFEDFQRAAAVTNVTTANEASTIAPWVVSQGNVDLVTSAHWQPFEGTQSIDLAGSTTGGRIQQGVATIPGHQYEVDFHYSANPDGSPVQKKFELTFGDTTSQVFFPVTTGETDAHMIWQPGSLVATAAAGDHSNVTFTDQDTTSFGAVIDGVTVTDVTAAASLPESPLVPFLAIGGLTVIGAITIRRRAA